MAKIKHIVFDHDGTLVDPSGQGRLYEGVECLLEDLTQNGVKLYVWTARTRFSTVEFLKSLGIIGRFELLSCSTDCEPKPCLEGLREMLPDIDPASVLMVGDGFADVIGAKNFGSQVIGAVWASPQGEERSEHSRALSELGASFVADSVPECATIINGLI